MEFPSRVNYQKLLQVLGISIPESLPASTKCPICTTYNSLHVHRINSIATGYFCSECGFIGDSVQLFKTAKNYIDLDTACTDMLSIPDLILGNTVDIRAALVNYVRGEGVKREHVSNILNLGWSRLKNDVGDASNILWALGLWNNHLGASNLAPNFAILTINELTGVFDVDDKYFRKYKNKNRKLLCIPLFEDILHINGFLVFINEREVIEATVRDILPNKIGFGFFLSWCKSSRSTLVFNDPAVAALIDQKYKSDFTRQAILYRPPSVMVQDIPKEVSKPIFVYTNFIEGMKDLSKADQGQIYTADSYLMNELCTYNSNDLTKIFQTNARSFTKAFISFVNEATDMHILELANNLSLNRDQIQRIVNEAPTKQKSRLEGLLVETPENREIQVFDKIILYKNDCWYHNDVLVSECTFTIVSVTHTLDSGTVCLGNITYKGQTYNFSDNLKNITKDPVGWLQTFCIKEGLGIPQINKKYKSCLYDIAIAQAPPEVTSMGKELGWQVINNQDVFVFPKFELSGRGFKPTSPGQYLNTNINLVNVPDELTAYEVDDLLSDCSANRQFWDVLGYLIYDVSARKYNFERYNLCFVSNNYERMSFFLESIGRVIGSPTLTFSSSKKSELARKQLLAGESTLPSVVDYSANYRSPAFLSWITDTDTPIITSAPRIDLYNFSSQLPWVYVAADDLMSDGRYESLGRVFWLYLAHLLSLGEMPKYNDRDVRSSIQRIQYEALQFVAKSNDRTVPEHLCPSETSHWAVKPLLINTLERFVATCMSWATIGAVEQVTYLDNELPKIEDLEKIVYTNGQYLFPRDYLLPLFVKEGFTPPSSAAIEKDLKSCSNDEYSFRLHSRMWWRVPFAEVAYHRE